MGEGSPGVKEFVNMLLVEQVLLFLLKNHNDM